MGKYSFTNKKRKIECVTHLPDSRKDVRLIEFQNLKWKNTAVNQVVLTVLTQRRHQDIIPMIPG
jgi:hypothetical protein